MVAETNKERERGREWTGWSIGKYKYLFPDSQGKQELTEMASLEKVQVTSSFCSWKERLKDYHLSFKILENKVNMTIK